MLYKRLYLLNFWYPMWGGRAHLKRCASKFWGGVMGGLYIIISHQRGIFSIFLHIFRPLSDLPTGSGPTRPAGRPVGAHPTCRTSSGSGDPSRSPQIGLHWRVCRERNLDLTDLGSSPDLRDVQRVGRAFLRMRPSPDLPAVQRVGQAQEPALARPVPDVQRGWQSYW